MNSRKVIAMYSGGVCSHLAAKRAVSKYGRDSVTLLFSDTGIEDEDLYRFIREGAEMLGARLVTVSSGETFDDMIRRNRALPSNRMAFCSRELKTEPAKRWVKENGGELIVLGLDWTEPHRMRQDWYGVPVWYPMGEPPYLTKTQMFDEVEADGIRIPRLYRMGFQHNNCGGGCVRGGLKAWAHLSKMLPEKFEEWAKREELIPGASFAKKVVNGNAVPITLRQIAADASLQASFDWGGCGCFSQEPSDE